VVKTIWRLPTSDEREHDTRVLSSFVKPDKAAAIAAMPIVVPDPEASAPFALRADAWLWRTTQLLEAWP
jgi:hypothetical protein